MVHGSKTAAGLAPEQLMLLKERLAAARNRRGTRRQRVMVHVPSAPVTPRFAALLDEISGATGLVDAG